MNTTIAKLLTHNPTASPAEINEDNFQKEVLKEARPVLVDFHAVWCGPCQMMKPYLAELASDYVDRMKFVSMDIDLNPKVSMLCGVRSVPAFVFFRNGQVVDQLIGSVPGRELVVRIEFILRKLDREVT
jgi:thioredoxin 1